MALPGIYMARLPTGRLASALLLASFGSASAASPDVAAPPGPGVVGTWQVEHVLDDRSATHKVELREDDPRLVGRFLTIGADEVLFRTLDGDEACKSPSFETARTTAGALVAQTMAGRGGPPATPTPADYGLGLEPGSGLDARWLACRSGALGPGFDERKNTWLVGLPEHRLAMGYYGSTILVLEPVPAGAAPAASFPCAKAATPPEKAICGSRELASLDRSVGASFSDDLRQFSATGDPAASAKLKATQKEWLLARDRCGADEGCLRKAMGTRLQALADTEAFTGE